MTDTRAHDYRIVRDLAKQVAEIAALPVQEETRRLWRALNRLQPVRPMVLIDEVPWHEMNVDDELTVTSEDFICQLYERHLRQVLYAWKHLRVDQVVEPAIQVPISITPHDYMNFGMQVRETIRVSDAANAVVSHAYEDQLQNEDDLEKIVCPRIAVHEVYTRNFEEQTRELFDGILTIHPQGWTPYCAPWDQIVELRGAERVLLDLAERPEFMHKLIARFSAAHLELLDQCENLGLISSELSVVHCSGAYSDELPASIIHPLTHHARDVWGRGMAQIFSAVSPAMHKEFDLDYLRPWYERFGLVYYGCCEPLHRKIDILRTIPNLRKISMSPWADMEEGAQRIGGDFVFSCKPNPAYVASAKFDEAFVEKDLRDTLASCKRHGCPTEFILKDISTVNYQPRRLWQWAEIARKVVQD